MKQINIALIFIIIMIPIIVIQDIKANELAALASKKIEYNKAFESAIDDGIHELVEVDSNRQLVLHKENGVRQFYQSLYANFGVLGNKLGEDNLRKYIPIILITDHDGFYIHYQDVHMVNGEKFITKKYSEKFPYSYEDDNYIYSFTLEDYIYIMDKNTFEVYEGIYTDLLDEFDELSYSVINDQVYDEFRRASIIDTMEVKMNYYVNHHNKIASQFGIEYNFWLPTIDEGDWSRTIDNIGILVIMQGYPYGSPGASFNRYGLSAARLKKSKLFYLSGLEGVLYYHKEGCGLLEEKEVAYYTKEECALAGAYPCLECLP